MNTKNRLCLRTFKQSVIVRFSFFIIKNLLWLFSVVSGCKWIFVVHLKLFIEKNGRRLKEITGNVCALKQGRKVGISEQVLCSKSLHGVYLRIKEVSKGMN